MRPVFRASFACLLLAGCAAQAQIYKCPDGSGKITYSQAPCSGAGQLLDSRRPSEAPPRELTQRREVERARRIDAAESPTPAPAVVPGAQASGCLDEQQVRNIEAAATSIRLDALNRQVHAEQIRRARACEPLMSAAEMAAMKDTIRAQRRASRPPLSAGPTLITNCDAGGCWGTDGTRYNGAAGGDFVRQDGAFCLRSGNTLQCN